MVFVSLVLVYAWPPYHVLRDHCHVASRLNYWNTLCLPLAAFGLSFWCSPFALVVLLLRA